MKLQLAEKQNESYKEISFLKFPDVFILETVTFWANRQYQSPQFPLDLSPTIIQYNELYPGGEVPDINNDSGFFEFIVSVDQLSEITDLTIIQLQAALIGESDEIPTASYWQEYFDFNPNGDQESTCIPDGSAYVSPKNEAEQKNRIVIRRKEKPFRPNELYLRYSILVSFTKNEGDSVYYARIDPFMKVSSNA